MRQARRVGWPGAPIALAVLALGFAGIALASGTRSAATGALTVTMTDKKLVLSHKLVQAGRAKLVIANKGRKVHVLAISGPGLAKPKSRTVRPGKRAELVLTLKAGAYVLWDEAGRVSASAARWLTVAPATPSTGSSREVLPFPPPVPMDCD